MKLGQNPANSRNPLSCLTQTHTLLTNGMSQIEISHVSHTMGYVLKLWKLPFNGPVM